MDVPLCYGKVHFQQHHSGRYEALKEKIASIYTSTAKGILMSPPFSYCESISREVSEGIVNYGDKLMCNAMAESDDEDEEMDELNQLGDDFQAMVDLTLLVLTIDENEADAKKDVVQRLYTLPKKGFHISQGKTLQFMKAIEEMRNYLKTRAFQGFIAAIALLGEVTEDGVVFGGKQTVPVEVIEGQIQNMLAGRGKQLTPLAVDLIMVQNGQLKVSTIRANEDVVDHFRIDNG